MTRNYETVFIVHPSATDQKLGDIKTRNQQIIENFQGKVVHVDDWGKKKLTYPIRKELKGHYFCLTYTANTSCVAELERNMRINEDIMRFITVKLDDKIDPLAGIAAFKSRLEAQARRERERMKERERFERPGPMDDEIV